MHYIILFCFSLTEIIIGLFECNAIYFRCGLAKNLYMVIKVFPQRDKESLVIIPIFFLSLFILSSLWLLKLGFTIPKKPKCFYMSHACTGILLTLSWRKPLSYRNQSIDLRSKKKSLHILNKIHFYCCFSY